MRTSCLVSGALALFTCSPLWADNLEEMIVVANRVQQSLSNSLASVEVIDAKQIATSQAVDLFGLLDGHAGISLSRDGGTGKNTSLFLRGTDSDHTLVYLDDQPINGLADGRARLEYLPLDQIDHIEIVRGARSSLYGSEAIGGVIRLFTRQPQANGLGGNLSLVGGSNDYRSIATSVDTSIADTGVRASFSDTDFTGFNVRTSGDPDRDGYKNRSWQLSAEHQFANGNSLRLEQSRTDGSSDYDEPGWTPGSIDGHDNYLRLNTSLSANLHLASSWGSKISVGHFKDAYNNNGMYGLFVSDSQRDTASWINTFTASDWKASLGVDFDQDSYLSNYLAKNEARDNLALLSYVEFGSQRFPLSASLRNDWNEQYGSHTTGSFTAGWNPGAIGRFWASIGTAFKAPNFFDLYGFGGDPNLRPEESTSYELGWHYLASDSLYSASLFRIRTRNLIEFDNVLFQILNSGDASIHGLEFTAETQVAEYELGASYTYLQTRNLDTGEELVRRPHNTLRIDLSRQWGALNLKLVGLAQSGRYDIGQVYLNGYQTLDLLLSYKLQNNLNLRAKLANLFNRDYQLVDGFNTPGRTFQASVDYRF